MNQHRSCKLEASGNLGKTFARHCGRHEQTPWRWKRFSFRWKMFLQVEKSQPSWNRWKEVSLSCKKRKIPEVGSVHCTVAHCALLSTEWGESFAPNYHLPASVIYLFSPLFALVNVVFWFFSCYQAMSYLTHLNYLWSYWTWQLFTHQHWLKFSCRMFALRRLASVLGQEAPRLAPRTLVTSTFLQAKTDQWVFILEWGVPWPVDIQGVCQWFTSFQDQSQSSRSWLWQLHQHCGHPRQSCWRRARREGGGVRVDGSRCWQEINSVIRPFQVFPDEKTHDQLFNGIKFTDIPIVLIRLHRNNTKLNAMLVSLNSEHLLETCLIL